MGIERRLSKENLALSRVDLQLLILTNEKTQLMWRLSRVLKV